MQSPLTYLRKLLVKALITLPCLDKLRTIKLLNRCIWAKNIISEDNNVHTFTSERDVGFGISVAICGTEWMGLRV